MRVLTIGRMQAGFSLPDAIGDSRSPFLGVVQNLPFSGYTGVRKAPAFEGRIATYDVPCAGGYAPPRGVKPAGAEAVPGPAG
jgi:hypothetical protein